MSVREEEQRRKNNCTNRGLGLAAAAIGVGVGAALYYFFSKRPENPDSEGSTSGNWSCEEPQSLIITQASDKLEYTTISEHTTTDTSIWLTDNDKNYSRKKNKRKFRNRHSSESDSSTSTMDSSYEESCCACCDNSSEPETAEEYTVTDTENSEEESEDSSEEESEDSSEEEEEDSNSSESNTETEYDSSLETGYMSLRTTSSHSVNQRIHDSSDSEIDSEWDITSSSADMPTDTSSWSSPYFLNFINRLTSPRLRNMTPAQDEQTPVIRDQTFRDRRWSLEECAICFDVMLKDQPLMQLPCTHNFHVACIGPWLREQQTCPMCRKAAE